MARPPLADLAVVLAAGGGTRIGGPKGLLDLVGAPLVRRHVDALRPWCTEVIVVVGARADHHAELLPDVRLVHNPGWAREWPVDSLARALRATVPRPAVVLVTPVDTSPARPDLLAALLAAGAPAVPTDPAGRDGHPVALGPQEIAAVIAHPPDGGLRTLLARAARVPVAHADIADDFDTPDAWVRFVRGYRSDRT